MVLEQDVADRLKQARAAQLIAASQFEKGYWELCLKAMQESRKALSQIASSGDEAGRLACELETLAARAHHARGEEPPRSERRVAALQVVQELGRALAARDPRAFKEATGQLTALGGFTAADTSRAFAPALEQDEEGAARFLAEHMPSTPDGCPEGAASSQLEPTWLSELCCLRTFPCPLEQQEGCGEGPAEGLLTWRQSCGQITLNIRLVDGPRPQVPGGWAEEDVVVELSQRMLRVSLGGSPLKWLTSDLYGEIWRKDSWWCIDEQASAEDAAVLAITLFKRQQRTWQRPWTTPVRSDTARTSFPWNNAMREHGGNHHRGGWGDAPPQDLPDESGLEAVPPGRPDPEEDEPAGGGGYLRAAAGGVFAPSGERLICRPEDICLGISAEQDQNSLIIEVHFERASFIALRQRYPIEKLFAVDVWEKAVCIFIQGDKQNPILWGELGGACLPYHTTWRLTSSEKMRTRQGDTTLASPALEIRIRKAPQSRGDWPKLFGQCVQARLMRKTWEPGAPRYDGLKGLPTAPRAGYDLDDPDFWRLVDGYCSETMKKTGASSAPRRLVPV